jgi:hypothetical protein
LEQLKEVATGLRCRASALFGRHGQHRPDLSPIHTLAEPRFDPEIVANSSKQSLEGVDSRDRDPALDPGNG